MRVRILNLAQGAYAAIENGYATMDVLLPAGCGAPEGLRRRAQELREELMIKARRADLMEAAALKIEEDKASGRQFSTGS